MNDTVETQAVTTLSRLYDEILTKGTILMNRVQTVAKTLDVLFVCCHTIKQSSKQTMKQSMNQTMKPSM